MNHELAGEQLYDQGWLLGGRRRRKALEFLLGARDAKAVSILIGAVEKGHPEAALIQHGLKQITDLEAVGQLAEAWRARHPEWLGTIAVECGLAAGLVDQLPLDEKTAWLVGARLGERDALSSNAQAYVERLIAVAPDFLERFLFKFGLGARLDRTRAVVPSVLALLQDDDPAIRAGVEAWIRVLPNNEEWNDFLVDEWVRTESPFLAGLVTEPRLPSDPAKEALVQLVRGDVAGYRKLEDTDGTLMTEALRMAKPEMRKAINRIVVEARDGVLATAYRRASMVDPQADPELALKALISSGDEDALFKATRTMTLAEVLPICRHWAETGRRPDKERPRGIVDRAVTALKAMPEVEVEPAAPLPKGLRDIFEVWQEEQVSDKQLHQDLESPNPITRARGLFLGSERGVISDDQLRSRAKSTHWPERLIVALRHPELAAKDDPVFWINGVAGVEGDLMSARIDCGPEELERSQKLIIALRGQKGKLAARNSALAEILGAFREMSGGWIQVTEDDSAQDRRAVRVTEDAVSPDDLKF